MEDPVITCHGVSPSRGGARQVVETRLSGCVCLVWFGRDKLRKTRGAADAESGEDRLPLGRTGQPLNLDMDAPSEVRELAYPHSCQ